MHHFYNFAMKSTIFQALSSPLLRNSAWKNGKRSLIRVVVAPVKNDCFPFFPAFPFAERTRGTRNNESTTEYHKEQVGESFRSG